MYAKLGSDHGIAQLVIMGDNYYNYFMDEQVQKDFKSFDLVETQFKKWWPTFEVFSTSIVPSPISQIGSCLWCVNERREYKDAGIIIRAIKQKRFGKLEASCEFLPICHGCFVSLMKDLYGKDYADAASELYSEIIEAAAEHDPNKPVQGPNLKVEDEGKEYVVCPEHIVNLLSGETPKILGLTYDPCEFCMLERVEKHFPKLPKSTKLEKAKTLRTAKIKKATKTKKKSK